MKNTKDNGDGKMARKITDPKKGVAVKINPANSKKVLKVIEKTHRTFASEVNVAVEDHVDRRLSQSQQSNTAQP